MQSTVFDDAFRTDASLVVSAPTGSGKTAIFELAIIRELVKKKGKPDLLKDLLHVERAATFSLPNVSLLHC